MHAPSDLVYASSPPIITAHTIAVSHQFPCTTAKISGTTTNAFQSHSPTFASLKSFGAAIDRQAKSRQNNSSMNGTTTAAPNSRTAMNAHITPGDAKNFSG